MIEMILTCDYLGCTETETTALGSPSTWSNLSIGGSTWHEGQMQQFIVCEKHRAMITESLGGI